MNLPSALAPWAPYLSDFPLDVGAALGGLAQRMAALLGPNGPDFNQPEGEVDGYDGLSRRGLPERMLLSDWLLAEEVPDEWARRAVEGELSYLQLARRAPQMSLVVAALFDAGPDVLGAPRLGQLAALLVLARRAREMGAELVWGIVQKPTEQLWHDVSPSGAMALLEARGSLPATASDIELWREALGARDELWLVGGPDFAELALPDESKLLFEDPFEAVRALDVAAYCHGREVRRARLELPADALCTRLLRDPFGTKIESSAQVRRIKASITPTSNLVWIGGNMLAVRSSSGGIVVFRVPSSPRGGVAKPKHYQFNGEEFHFVGEYGGSIVGAQLEQKGVRLHNIGGRAQNIATGLYSMQNEDDWSSGELNSRPLQPLWNLTTGSYRPVLLLPGSNFCRLVSATVAGNETYEIEVVEQKIRSMEGFKEGIVTLSDSTPARVMRFEADYRTPTGFSQGVLLFRGEVDMAFRGCSCFLKEDKDWWGVGAYQTPEGWFMQWMQEEETRFDRIEIALGETVFGVVGWKIKPSPALLVRGEQGRGLMLRGLGWNHSLSASDEIESAVVSPSSSYLAWATKNELTIYSLALDTVLARWQWGEAE